MIMPNPLCEGDPLFALLHLRIRGLYSFAALLLPLRRSTTRPSTFLHFSRFAFIAEHVQSRDGPRRATDVQSTDTQTESIPEAHLFVQKCPRAGIGTCSRQHVDRHGHKALVRGWGFAARILASRNCLLSLILLVRVPVSSDSTPRQSTSQRASPPHRAPRNRNIG